MKVVKSRKVFPIDYLAPIRRKFLIIINIDVDMVSMLGWLEIVVEPKIWMDCGKLSLIYEESIIWVRSAGKLLNRINGCGGRRWREPRQRCFSFFIPFHSHPSPQ